ncbi:sensor histidine kinase [Nocardioides pocheonensis]|uniref:Sensor histidine kinase n=1 Tax=Nocardioides pocheonensis TaxID=661485 RepID=A0A3N0GJM4_9ACTN|nr:sensor histidine kinase [Nocardioides pocheonensis]RNM12416.1 sensor histidine kinase [Nocardioides pocheonensis]
MNDVPPATSADPRGAVDQRSASASSEAERWVVVSQERARDLPEVRRPERLVAVIAVGAVLVLALSVLVGVVAARKLAERQAVNDAANTADLLAEAVVQPVLTDAIASGDPAAVAAVGSALADYLENSSLVRVKVWTKDGRIVYSDEPRLLGQRYQLSEDAQDVFAHPATRAEVSDLNKPENQYERGQGRLLEAYRPIWTPSGTPLLFETYAPYTEVDGRAGQLWRGFAGVTVSTLLLFAALLIPLVWQLLTGLRSAQRQREALLERAIEASDDERRRIAGTLHDGVVQELAATSFAVTAAAGRAQASGDPDLARDLTASAATLRDSMGGLRTLLVDLYPPTLETAGIQAALRDLGGRLRARGIEVTLDLPETDPGLGPELDRLVFRVAHECLENVRRHASATRATIRMTRMDDAVVLEVTDDGVGFDVEAVLAHPPVGHLGVRLLADAASRSGAELAVSSSPGHGCRWRLTVPAP